jgi:hypothetical protein
MPAPSPSNHPSFIPSHRHHQHSRPPHPRHHHHVCSTQDNWIETARPRPAAFRDEGHHTLSPRLCDQRARSERPQDEFRRCARCQAQQRIHPDPRGKCSRGNEAQARLQRRHRLPDFVRRPLTRIRLHMANMSQQLLSSPQACHGWKRAR